MEACGYTPIWTTAGDAGGGLRGLSLLVADDNATMQALLRQLLRREGARVTISGDGEQAARAVRAPELRCCEPPRVSRRPVGLSQTATSVT